MSSFCDLSSIQKKLFKETSGHDFVAGQLNGKIETTRPHNREFGSGDPAYSRPWVFSYVFQPDTGFLICELSHRMTNNETFGWDQEGNAIERKFIESVFPLHW